MGDLGVQATYDILDDLKAKVKEKHIKEPMECRELLIESIKEQMDIGETAYEFENCTSVVMVIGVNGVGKTTTIGKLAAGRLHNKKNLMEELRKMNKIIDREFPEAYRETLVVLDATTGQNALQQAKEFNDVAEITGIILTKMDGTAKGGIAVAIHAELGVPVKYIGVGETIDDLQKFNADDFVNALFERPKDDEASEEVSENE